MALPNENKTAKVVAVEQAIGKMSPQELAALPALDASDFQIFGTLIQYFSFIDLNLRRALELFKLAKMLPKTALKQYPNLTDRRSLKRSLRLCREWMRRRRMSRQHSPGLK